MKRPIANLPLTVLKPSDGAPIVDLTYHEAAHRHASSTHLGLNVRERGRTELGGASEAEVTAATLGGGIDLNGDPEDHGSFEELIVDLRGELTCCAVL